jgi:prevent-host-death family protein
MVTATMFEAKTNLSALVKKAQSGETVIITSGRNKTPVAKLSPIEPVQPVVKRRLGAMLIPGYEIPDSFWDPLPEDELRLWEGEGE